MGLVLYFTPHNSTVGRPCFYFINFVNSIDTMANKKKTIKAAGKLKQWLESNDFTISTTFSCEESWTHSTGFSLVAGKIPAYFNVGDTFTTPARIMQLFEIVMGYKFPGKA